MSAKCRAVARRAVSAAVMVACGAPGARAQEATFFTISDLPGGGVASGAEGVSDDGRLCVGYASGATGVQPVVSANGVLLALPLLPGFSAGIALSVSGDGAIIVGQCDNGDALSGRACRWEGAAVFTGVAPWGYEWIGTITDLGVLPGFMLGSRAGEISRDGRVIVGWSRAGDGGGAYRGFWIQNGVMHELQDLPGGWGDDSTAGTVNADGSMIAGRGVSVASSGTGRYFEACAWNPPSAAAAPLGDLGGGRFFSEALGISADGAVVVGYGNAPDTSTDGLGQACRWVAAQGPDGMTMNALPLGDLPGGEVGGAAHAVSDDGRIIVGLGMTAVGREAMVWTPCGEAEGEYVAQRLADSLFERWGLVLPQGYRLLTAKALTPDGTTIVGEARIAHGNQEGYVIRVPTWDNPGVIGGSLHAAACPAGTATLSVTAAGVPSFTYRWQREDADAPGAWADLHDGVIEGVASFGGVTTSALTIADATERAASGSRYRCVVSNACGSAISHPATLIVCPADWNCADGVDSQDFFDFIEGFFAGDADFNGADGTDSQDYFDFVEAFFSGC